MFTAVHQKIDDSPQRAVEFRVENTLGRKRKPDEEVGETVQKNCRGKSMRPQILSERQLLNVIRVLSGK